MDLNATTKTILNSNQENNQLLLDAIRNKFAAQTANEAAAFSPPKFNIPLLKIPGNGSSKENSNVCNTNKLTTSQTSNNTPAATQLNHFLLKQLQEKHTANGEAKEQTGFVLPQLQTAGNNKVSMKFELPLLKQQPAVTVQQKENKISSLTTAINKLQVQDRASEADLNNLTNSANIDLTTALASKLLTHQGTPPSRDFLKLCKEKDNEIDFDIPFIDCDRLDNSRKHALLLPISNEYCVTDISKLLLQHSFVEPSAIGRFLSIDDDKYTPPLPLECLSKEYRQQRVKHQIAPFRFETMSPDDIVLEALNKYQRRHYN